MKKFLKLFIYQAIVLFIFNINNVYADYPVDCGDEWIICDGDHYNIKWPGITCPDDPHCGRGYYELYNKCCWSGTLCKYTRCDICPKGTFQGSDNYDGSNCTICPTGFYCPERGHTGAPPANPGIYHTKPYVICPVGYYCSSTTGHTGLPPYNSSTGNTNPIKICPAGHRCPLGTSIQYGYRCHNGQYQDATQQGTCKTCPTGQITPNDSAPHIACISCDAGTYTASPGQNSCTTCEAGYSCLGNANKSACGVGFYQDETGQIECKKCPEHASCPNAVNTTFTCNTGYHLSYDKGVAFCEADTVPPTNSYKPDYDIAKDKHNLCTACPQGNTAISTHTGCVCSARYGFKEKNGATSICSLCHYGYYKEADGDTLCTACGENQYTLALGSKTSAECLTCPSGTTVTSSRNSCECAKGYFYSGKKDLKGMPICELCPKHTYKHVAGNLKQCISCPMDTITSEDGADSPDDCACRPGFILDGSECKHTPVCSIP